MWQIEVGRETNSLYFPSSRLEKYQTEIRYYILIISQGNLKGYGRHLDMLLNVSSVFFFLYWVGSFLYFFWKVLFVIDLSLVSKALRMACYQTNPF
jgi:hypothetical protein